MYFQSTRPMMYQDLIKEMKAYEKGFGENHLQKIVFLYFRFLLSGKEEGRRGAYIYRTEGFRISLYGQGGIGQNS